MGSNSRAFKILYGGHQVWNQQIHNKWSDIIYDLKLDGYQELEIL